MGSWLAPILNQVTDHDLDYMLSLHSAENNWIGVRLALRERHRSQRLAERWAAVFAATQQVSGGEGGFWLGVAKLVLVHSE